MVARDAGYNFSTIKWSFHTSNNTKLSALSLMMCFPGKILCSFLSFSSMGEGHLSHIILPKKHWNLQKTTAILFPLFMQSFFLIICQFLESQEQLSSLHIALFPIPISLTSNLDWQANICLLAINIKNSSTEICKYGNINQKKNRHLHLLANQSVATNLSAIL